jgi:hypothetical protein
MNQAHHDPPGHHAGHHSDHHHEANSPRRQYHKDWRLWVAVVVILAAMATYVLTNGEVLRPVGRGPAEQVPISK